MVRLREIPRTAAFAWSPGAIPFIATGTRSGAVDADFSNESKLELWDLNLDSQGQDLELQPIASVGTDSRFYDIAWGPPNANHPRGIIAGGMESGNLELYDAAKLFAHQDALISRIGKHTGPIKSLQFNPLKPQILVTAGAKGELFVWDMDDTSNPFRLGSVAARADDIDCVAWNPKVANILAAGGAGGFVAVWDLKTKKSSLTLNNNRKPVSAIAWDPTNSTNLLTATSDDSTPVILLWNLRNSQAPEKSLKGHDQGVLSLAWCQQDPSILISTGKDNRTALWNPQTGERHGELPEATNWTFLARFSPSNPNLTATASFDGKITIQTLQNTNPAASTIAQTNLNDDDFFSKAPTQPQTASFTLPKPPTWFERPVGVVFGYGGKLVVFRKEKAAVGQKRSSKIKISQVSVDSEIGSATEKFEEALRGGDITAICKSHIENAKTEEEKAEWQVLRTLNDSDGRSKIVDYLGFSKDDIASSVGEGRTESGTESGAVEAKSADTSTITQANGDSGEKKHRRAISSLWENADDGEDFLSDLAATKGAKTDNPFQLFSDEKSTTEDLVTRALMLGDFEQAADICLKEDRMADAFILANCGGKDLLDKIQKAYLGKNKSSSSYLRLISSVVAKNLWDVVYNADLSHWKEIMVTLCTFADPTEFPDLCEALGDRIYESGSRKDASFCYLVGSKLEKVVNIWIDELTESEQAGLKESTDDSTFSVHARSLQQFIEKITVFRQVINFVDTELAKDSGWKLESLYNKYVEYADIVAAHGQLGVARKYLELLPTKYPAAEIARNRVKLATQTAAPNVVRQAVPATKTSSRAQVSVGYQQPTPYGAPGQVHPQAPVPNPYAPPTPFMNANGPSNPGVNAYASPAQQFQGYAPPSQSYGPPPALGGYGAPTPMSFGQQAAPAQASGPPPRSNQDVGGWNDVPMVVKAPTRKSTPRAVPIPSPFSGQNLVASPPDGAAPFARSILTPPLPPPKASAPPRNLASSISGPSQTATPIARPPSRSSNALPNPQALPSGPSGFGPQSMGLPRNASPYHPLPSNAPPSNRYAPAPATQQHGQPPAGTPHAPPYQSASTQYARPPQARPLMAGPPQAGGPPMTAGPPHTGVDLAAGTPAPPAQPTPPSRPRHPAGDRSHIPPTAQRLVQILDEDMQRVASKAPVSFAPQVKDTEKRLKLLFDHLNNGELLKEDTIGQLTSLAMALANRDYSEASKLQVEIQRDKSEECGQWMVGIRRLIGMSKATP